MDQEEEMRRLRKAVADAYGEDRAWMTATGRAEELIREARTHQKLILANSRLGVEVRRGAIEALVHGSWAFGRVTLDPLAIMATEGA